MSDSPGDPACQADKSDGAASPVHQLWSQWRREDCPDFTTFAAAAALTAEQMLALLRFDQHERWRSGQRIPAETYLQRYALLQQDAELALVLIYSEFLLRSELGERP